MSTVPIVKLREVKLYERRVHLRLPFRFGMTTLTEAPQVFVRTLLELPDGESVWGSSAELLAPKWFDKNPDLSNAANFDQLRLSISLACDHYLNDDAQNAFGYYASSYSAQIDSGARHGLNPLLSGFGPALLDKAIVDALCRGLGISFYDAIRCNLVGLQPSLLLDEFAGFDMNAWLLTLKPADSILLRHTVGLSDVLSGNPQQLDDGLPESLEQVIKTYHPRWFKLKISGDVDSDIERLSAIASVLDTSVSDYRISLDGNEQYGDVEAMRTLLKALQTRTALRRLANAIAFIEQPINRQLSLQTDVSDLAQFRPLIIDEADSTLDSFPQARQLGYLGISSKSFKGLYKAIINAARCQRWREEDGRPYFITGEDLTTQSGLALQQDLALASLLGVAHVERNGHFYGNGMTGLPAAEQQAFLDAHADLYQHEAGAVRPRIRNGTLSIGSLACTGFASAAEPDWSDCQPLEL